MLIYHVILPSHPKCIVLIILFPKRFFSWAVGSFPGSLAPLSSTEAHSSFWPVLALSCLAHCQLAAVSLPLFLSDDLSPPWKQQLSLKFNLNYCQVAEIGLPCAPCPCREVEECLKWEMSQLLATVAKNVSENRGGLMGGLSLCAL